jgi:hypothetical protein
VTTKQERRIAQQYATRTAINVHCYRKTAYVTQQDAWNALLAMRQNQHGALLNIYICRYAFHYHIGHAKGYHAELLYFAYQLAFDLGYLNDNSKH